MTIHNHATKYSLIASLAAALCLAPLSAQAKPKLVAGTLTCKGQGTIGLVLGSKERLACEYAPAGRGDRYGYSGRITKVGLDVGFKTGSIMVWTVLGASKALRPGELNGKYTGVSAQAAIALGAGANALVGGSRRSVVLQPLSVEGQTGLNLAVGVAQLTLRH